MTDAEKMREAAGQIVAPYRKTISDTPDLLSLLYDADLLPEQIVTPRAAVCMAAVVEAYQAGRRALPIPVDASAPASGCQQAALVTVDAGLLDEVKAALASCLRQLDDLVAESGRGIDWGYEDAFRMGEWFEERDLAEVERARAALARLEREVG